MSSFAALPETVREEALSRADLAWLHAEAPTNHFVVTSLALFDEPLNVDRFKTMLSQRIALHPRLSQVITTPLNPLAGQRWSAARDFDLAAHIHRTALAAPGGLKALAAYVGGLAGRPLDPGRPLWPKPPAVPVEIAPRASWTASCRAGSGDQPDRAVRRKAQRPDCFHAARLSSF